MDFVGLGTSFLAVLFVSCSLPSIHGANGAAAQPGGRELSADYYFALMISSAPTLNTSAVVPAIDEVLEAVNSDGGVLVPGVRLQYASVLDTQVGSYIPCGDSICVNAEWFILLMVVYLLKGLVQTSACSWYKLVV